MSQVIHLAEPHSSELPTNMQAPCDSPTAGEREPAIPPVRQRPVPPRTPSRSGTFWNPPTPKNT